ncbi:MAG TPA: deoxyribodipyrimidine photo-lyase [Gammaproteobacteria bacterium]|nr:deoxyribodipyrimidine photo-lyase [Gammaproteobacteria bacterium]
MKKTLVWLRQDLRLLDNPALYHACALNQPTIIIYILDEAIYPLGGAQCWWLHYSLEALQKDLLKKQSKLILKKGIAENILIDLIESENISHVFWNRCYEPLAIERDTHLKQLFTKMGIIIESFNASLLNEPHQIKTKEDSFFKIFTYYWKTCCAHQKIKPLLPIPVLINSADNTTLESDDLPTWDLLPKSPDWSAGLKNHWQPGEAGAKKQLKNFIKSKLIDYANARDFPAKSKTSFLSPHLHFGEISPWQIYHILKQIELENAAMGRSVELYLTQLGWREFSYYLLYHYPKLPEKNFKSRFDNFPWVKSKKLLQAWQKGKTGYPIVDAGMRQLWYSGYMHNRVRMIVASFLTKDLLIDWRVGADWFWDTLVDADLANNSASWQWVAGSGTDASPYFRIFNPTLQGEKFDPNGDYVRRWIPELKKLPNKYIHKPWETPETILNSTSIRLGTDYPLPIIDHCKARQHALELYKKTSNNPL